MAHGGVPARFIMPLLQPRLDAIELSQLLQLLQALDEGYAHLTSVGTEQPSVPNTPADLKLLERLKREGIVSSYDSGSSRMKVCKRHK